MGESVCISLFWLLKAFRELFQSTEGHAHDEDTGIDYTVVRDLIADDGALGKSCAGKDRDLHGESGRGP